MKNLGLSILSDKFFMAIRFLYLQWPSSDLSFHWLYMATKFQ